MDSISIRKNFLEQHFIQKGFYNHPKWSFILDKIIPSIVQNKCLVCNSKFFNEYSTKRHFYCKHEQLIPVNLFEDFEKKICEICNITFFRKDKYNNHMVKHKKNDIANDLKFKLDDFWTKKGNDNTYGIKRKIEHDLDTDKENDSQKSESISKLNIKRQNSPKRVRFSSVLEFESKVLLEMNDNSEQYTSELLKRSNGNEFVILDDENEDILQMQDKNEIKKQMSNIKFDINQFKIRYSLLKKRLEEI